MWQPSKKCIGGYKSIMLFRTSTSGLQLDLLMHLNQNYFASKSEDADIDIPVPMGLSYLPYQRAGIAFGLKNPGVLIADEPGLGKTIQAIGIMNADPKMRHILIVCPASLKNNWARELNKWLMPKENLVKIPDTQHVSTMLQCDKALHVSYHNKETGDIYKRTIDLTPSVVVVNGMCNDEGAARRLLGADIVVINYELLPSYIDVILQCNWDMVVADECHVLRNTETQRTQHFVGSIERSMPPIPATRRVFLTGTPILNRAKDVWALISYLNPSAWNSYEEFAQRFCQKEKGAAGTDDSGSSNLGELQKILRGTVMIRRLKRDVLGELLPKRRHIVKLEHNSPHIGMLLAEEARIMGLGNDWEQYSYTLEQLQNTQKARLAETSRIRHAIALAKVPYVIKYIEAELMRVEKIVIFAHHQDVVEQIAQYFKAVAVSFTGQSSATAKQDAVDRFQTDPEVRICVASILAAGVGITLTAANTVIFAELDWTGANVTQAEDRCHRIGQKRQVEIVHLILEKSIDMHIAQKVVEKQAIYKQALD